MQNNLWNKKYARTYLIEKTKLLLSYARFLVCSPQSLRSLDHVTM